MQDNLLDALAALGDLGFSPFLADLDLPPFLPPFCWSHSVMMTFRSRPLLPVTRVSLRACPPYSVRHPGALRSPSTERSPARLLMDRVSLSPTTSGQSSWSCEWREPLVSALVSQLHDNPIYLSLYLSIYLLSPTKG